MRDIPCKFAQREKKPKRCGITAQSLHIAPLVRYCRFRTCNPSVHVNKQSLISLLRYYCYTGAFSDILKCGRIACSDSAHRGSDIDMGTVLEMDEEGIEKEGRMEARRKRRMMMMERKNTTVYYGYRKII